MLKDILLSFKDNIKDKTTNPFFGTFVIVGIVRNWDFLITLTNLDLLQTLEQKISILKPFFDVKTFLIGLWNNTWITIVVIILTYILLNVSRLIINFFEKKITPTIYELTDKGSIVLKTDYKKLKDEKELLEQRLEKERDNRLKIQSERDSLETRIIDLISKNIIPESPEIKENKIEILNPSENKISESLYSMVASREMLEDFKHIIESIELAESIGDNQDFIKYFLRLGLIKKGDAFYQGTSFYKLTEKGNALRELLIEKGEL